MIEIGINSEVLKKIIEGQKTVEGRLAKDKFLSIKPGDIISIREDIYKDSLIVKSIADAAAIQVIELKKFPTFKKMLTDVGFARAIPDAKDLEEACEAYELYYSAEDEQRYGVLAISFVLTK